MTNHLSKCSQCVSLLFINNVIKIQHYDSEVTNDRYVYFRRLDLLQGDVPTSDTKTVGTEKTQTSSPRQDRSPVSEPNLPPQFGLSSSPSS